MLTTVVAWLALIVALAALGLTISVMRQSGETTGDLRHHRRAHEVAHGHPDPKLDRRQVNVGPPRSTGERRGARHYQPDPERLAPRPVDEPHDVVALADAYERDAATGELAREGRVTTSEAEARSMVARGIASDPQGLLPTSELEAQDAPTSMLEAQRPDVPRRTP